MRDVYHTKGTVTQIDHNGGGVVGGRGGATTLEKPVYMELHPIPIK